jgi:2-haloalkanoic acid dehalogenase type II
MKLTDFTTLTFDCYGTLIDWESGLLAALAPLVARAGRAPESVLEDFGREEAAQEHETPSAKYSDLLAMVHRRLTAAWGVEASAAEHAAFGASVPDWPAFADSAEALAYLARHYRLVVLSNVDRTSFAGSRRRLGDVFSAVYTAEDIGSYKPNPANFRYLLAHEAQAGVAPGQILHTAQSLYHDHGPANHIGLASAWIDRRAGRAGGGATPPVAGVRWDFRFTSLGEMAAAHAAAGDAG